METFFEVGLVIGIAALVSIIMRFFKQPLIIGYILTGIIVGPSLLNLISTTDTITLFSHMGVALLLFVVGLGLDPKVIKEVGLVSIVTGVGQAIFTTAIGFFLSLTLGFSTLTSIYIGLALSFSSTILILKLLSDKNETETLYGKISIGFLLVQDLLAILTLIIVSSLNGGMNAQTIVVGVALKGLALLVGLFLIGLYILPHVTRVVAKNQEMLLLFSISWAFALSLLFFKTGFSLEIGALIAGVTLSLSPYRYEISSKMKPMRDFFLVLFFIMLGYQIGFSDLQQNIWPVILFSLLVLIGNPLSILILMGLMGHTKRNGFLAGWTVAQIGEFSHILIALGITIGHLGQEVLSIITAVALITIAVSSYLFLYAGKMYPHVSRYLSIFEKKNVKAAVPRLGHKKYDVILFGCDRVGHDLIVLFKRLKQRFLIVDHNPEIVSSLSKKGMKCIYGDASDMELLDELHLSKVKMVVSTIPDFEINTNIISKVREVNSSAVLVVVSHRAEEAIDLYEKGASYVILPHLLGGYHASMLIEKHGLSFDKFLKEKMRHLQHLKIATNEKKKLINASIRY
ncbi:MAG TPA: cation:proton antiporter [Candidatus Nanoarchaeia archaeon]|nr:cation:proton antiporter [Candidatus Nanoarchaeia archaeon]